MSNDKINNDDDLLPEVESYEENELMIMSIEDETMNTSGDASPEDDSVIEFEDQIFESICEAHWGDVGGINYDNYFEANNLNDELLHKILNNDSDTNHLFSKFPVNKSCCVKNVVYNNNNKKIDTDINNIDVAVLYYIIQTFSDKTVSNSEKLKAFRERSWDFLTHLSSISDNYDNWIRYSFWMPYYQYVGTILYKGYPVSNEYTNDNPNDWPFAAPVTLLFTKNPDQNNDHKVVILVGINNEDVNSSALNGLNTIIYANFVETLKYGMVTELDGVSVVDKQSNKHMVLTKSNDRQIKIEPINNSVLETLNSKVINALYNVLELKINTSDFTIQNSLIVQKQLSPDMLRSNEITYYKSNKSKNLNRFFGKISPYFIHQGDFYKNFHHYKLTSSEMSIPKKEFYNYQDKGFQPVFPSLGYYLIGRTDECQYSTQSTNDKTEYHTYLDNRIIKLDVEIDLKFSTTDAIKDNVRDYVYSTFKRRYKNVLGDEPKDKNSNEYKKYEKDLKYITELYKVAHTSIDSEIKDNTHHTTYNIKIKLK